VKTVLHTESSPGLGGQEIRTVDEARWTMERGWRVVAAGRADSPFVARARACGIETAALPMRGAWDLASVARLIALIRRERVSIVHTHSSVDAWLGGFAARATGIPVVRTRHVSIALRRGFNPVYTWLADRVITSGEAIRRILVQAGVPADRVIAIPAGVDLARFAFRARSPETAERLGLGAPVIGSVAMFRGSKGHRDLLDAFAIVRASYPTATLLLVGDGIRRRWVEELARQAGLGEAVVFTGFRSDVPALLGAMDCFALASTRTEGVPQSLLQAFAAGVPVVACDVGGIAEVVANGVTGLLVKSESPGALADAIEAVLADRGAADRRAAAARAVVEARSSRGDAVGRLLEVYAGLLASRGWRRPPAA
jgi:glycosyltransferase involved in cell wall biosynthesis